MVTVEPKVEVRLRAPLAEFMKGRRLTVRALQHKVSDHRRQWSKSTIGHLRKHTDRSVDPELADRLADALGVPYSFLFVERISNVHREVGRQEVA